MIVFDVVHSFFYKNNFIRTSRLRFGENFKNILMLKTVLVLKVKY